ncbi:putative DNA-binding domain protein [compost metagenome]
MRLIALQQAFERYLQGSDCTAPAELLQHLRGSEALSAEDGLQVYHHAYRARLLSVLREDFPATHYWLGTEAFEQLAQAYLAAWPPRHFSLRWLGEKLPEFISKFLDEPQASQLRELSELEWAFTLAFDAADEVSLSLQDTASFGPQDWTGLSVQLHPSVRWLTFNFNAIDIWKAAKADTSVPPSLPLEHPITCLVWRDALICQYRTLDPLEAAALQLMVREQLTFADLCLSLLESNGDAAPAQAASWLKQWVVDGIVVRVSQQQAVSEESAP